MEINRMIVSLAAGLLLLSFEGCSDAPREQGADVKPTVEKPSEVHSPLEDAKTELQALPRNVTEDRYPERTYYEGLRFVVRRLRFISPLYEASHLLSGTNWMIRRQLGTSSCRHWTYWIGNTRSFLLLRMIRAVLRWDCVRSSRTTWRDWMRSVFMRYVRDSR